MSWSTGSPLRAFLGRFVISLVVASLVVTAVVVAANREINNRIAKIPRIELALASPPPEGANFLLIGSDTRAFVGNADDAAKFGDAQSEGGQRSDTIMVAHVEPDSQRTFVVSFPRDLIVNIPGYGRGMINSAYGLANGDPQLLINTLDANFGIKINHYVQVDFQSFRSVVETIGQVWVYIPGKMRDQYSGLSTPYGAGCFPLNGEAALSYVRARDLEIADPNGNIVDDDGTRWRQYDLRADLDRIPRQQSFIRRLTGLAISKSLGDPTIAFELADNVLQYLTVDQNLGRSEINALVRAFRTVDVNDSSSLQMVTLPVVADPNDRNRVIPADDADTVVAALNTFGATTPKALPAPSQVTVDVVDGSGRDLGAGIVKTLGDYGFRARTQGSSAVPVAVSEIHYAPIQLAAAETLLAYLPEAKLVPDTTATAAVKVIVASDFMKLTVPSTTTTVPGHPATSTLVPTTTAPPTTTVPPTTTTTPFDQPCPQN